MVLSKNVCIFVNTVSDVKFNERAIVTKNLLNVNDKATIRERRFVVESNMYLEFRPCEQATF